MNYKSLPLLEDIPNWWMCWFWEANFRWNMETGCLEYVFPKKLGYPRITCGAEVYPAHRMAYFLYYGVDPKEMLVRHLCHNRNCSNPRHLALGTHWDNSQDMVRAGRSQKGKIHWTKRNPERLAELKEKDVWHPQKEQLKRLNGENHPKTKLTADLVREIKIRAANGEGNRALAEAFNVTHSNISAIVLGKSWAHVEVPTRQKDERFVRKLDEEEVQDIRLRLSNGESQASIARVYHIGSTTVYNIANDMTWNE